MLIMQNPLRQGPETGAKRGLRTFDMEGPVGGLEATWRWPVPPYLVPHPTLVGGQPTHPVYCSSLYTADVTV